MTALLLTGLIGLVVGLIAWSGALRARAERAEVLAEMEKRRRDVEADATGALVRPHDPDDDRRRLRDGTF